MRIVVRLDVMLARRKMRSRELARRVGITEQNISLLKAGKVKSVRFDTLARICAVLDCQPGDLLDAVPGAAEGAPEAGDAEGGAPAGTGDGGGAPRGPGAVSQPPEPRWRRGLRAAALRGADRGAQRLAADRLGAPAALSRAAAPRPC
ncbi:helix-turn-helix domain-containing protein, partial [Roseivivax sp. CAU 1761]